MMRTRSQVAVDSVASGLVSSVVIVGAIVFGLLAVWYSMRSSVPGLGFPTEIAGEAGRGDHAAGIGKEILPPGSEDAENLNEPSAEQLVTAITQASSEIAGSMLSTNSNADASFGSGGSGDRRAPGPLGKGDDVIPMHQRWDLRFQAGSLAQYAQQLDFHGIELACVGGSSMIDYASRLSKSPQKRSGTADEENRQQRLFFVWRTDNPLKRFDEQLLSQAPIKTEGRLILKICPEELKQKMLELEGDKLASSGHNSVQEIAKTVFESRPTSSGFELTIIEQIYR